MVEGLSETVLEQLHSYEQLLASRAVQLGVVAESDRERLWERHVVDSLRALACLRAEDQEVADLGSGGGLPGIPVAIARPTIQMTLVEARQRRVAFLEWAVETLSLTNVNVLASRIEDVSRTFDACLARALADPVGSWRLAEPLLRPGGRLVYFAGRALAADRLPADGVRATPCGDPGADFPSPGGLVIMEAIR